MKECTECLVLERDKKQSRNLYRGSARTMSVRGEGCNVNCLQLKAVKNADWDLLSKRELVYVSVCIKTNTLVLLLEIYEWEIPHVNLLEHKHTFKWSLCCSGFLDLGDFSGLETSWTIVNHLKTASMSMLSCWTNVQNICFHKHEQLSLLSTIS